MTAEVSVMNKTAVALAADSAATTKSPKGIKIHTSAEKIFQLLDDHKIGIMIHGSASLEGVPWEIIISDFKDDLGVKKLDNVKNYAEVYIDYINKNMNKYFPADLQMENAQQRIVVYFNRIIYDKFKSKLDSITTKQKKPTEKDYEKTISEILKEEHNIWISAVKAQGVAEKDIEKLANEYKDLIEASIEEFAKLLPIKLNVQDNNKLRDIAVSLFVKFPSTNIGANISGVIFAGFGTKETFPAMCVLEFECIADNILKYRYSRESKITHQKTSSIQAFAQGEMVYTFMEGVHPGYQRTIDSMINNIISNFPNLIIDNVKELKKQNKDSIKEKINKGKRKWMKEISNKLASYRKEQYVDPVVSSVTILPKDELASLAESLVNLTSLKRRVSIDQEETVGGPIDVALISKSEGFRWISRKAFYDKRGINN